MSTAPKDSNELQVYELVQQEVEQASVLCLKNIVGKTPTFSQIKPHERMNCDHWTSAISILLDFGSVGLKIHYISKSARAITSAKLKMDENCLPACLVKNTMEDYLNTCMGRVKRKFSSTNLNPSVPLTSPASDLDEPGFLAIDRENASWKLRCMGFDIYVSCKINLDVVAANRFAETMNSPVAETGKLEIL